MRRRGLIKRIGSTLVGLWMVSGFANTLPVAGATFPIGEPDLKEVLVARAAAFAATHPAWFQQQEAKALSHPDTGAPLPKATHPRLWEVATSNASTAFTPLLFINGEDVSEVQYALKEMQRQQIFQLILLGGNPITLGEALHHPLYVDQGGRLAAHFGIKAHPAWIIATPNGVCGREVVP